MGWPGLLLISMQTSLRPNSHCIFLAHMQVESLSQSLLYGWPFVLSPNQPRADLSSAGLSGSTAPCEGFMTLAALCQVRGKG